MLCRKYSITLKNILKSDIIELEKLISDEFASYLFVTFSKRKDIDVYDLDCFLVTNSTCSLSLVKMKVNGIFNKIHNNEIKRELDSPVDFILEKIFYPYDNSNIVIERFFRGKINSIPASDLEKFSIYSFHYINGFINLDYIISNDLLHYRRRENDYILIINNFTMKKNHKMFTIWISGKGNTYKSTISKLICEKFTKESPYYIPDTIYNVFDNYRGEESVIWDNYSGAISFDFLCNFLNKTGTNIITNNGNIYFKPKILVIISKLSIDNIDNQKLEELEKIKNKVDLFIKLSIKNCNCEKFHTCSPSNISKRKVFIKILNKINDMLE